MRPQIALSTSILLLSLFCCSQEKRFTQPNSAMEPTVLEGDKFAVDVGAYRDQTPARGEVIVFQHGDVLMLKRVIGISGDTIEGKNDQIFVNRTAIREDYVEHVGPGSVSPSFSFLKAFGPIKVPAGSVFVMGDNRDYSDDSRDPKFGSVAITDIRGQAIRIEKSKHPRREGQQIK